MPKIEAVSSALPVLGGVSQLGDLPMILAVMVLLLIALHVVLTHIRLSKTVDSEVPAIEKLTETLVSILQPMSVETHDLHVWHNEGNPETGLKRWMGNPETDRRVKEMYKWMADERAAKRRQ